jgi:hypothetical protein
MTIRRTGLLAFAACAVLVAWGAGRNGVSRAEEAPGFEGLQVTFAPDGVTFFDERSGDVWIHPFRITGATGVAHFRVTERGAKLTEVPAKK